MPFYFGRLVIRIFSRNFLKNNLNTKNNVMKQFIILLFLAINTLVIRAQPNPPGPIAQCVHFLESQNVSAKEYIISLFDRYDIFVFCERTHDEMTQYELLMDIMADKRFQDQVGDVFMEIGGSNFDTSINNYLFTENLTKEKSIQRSLEIQRDMCWYPLWARYNYHFLLTSLYN